MQLRIGTRGSDLALWQAKYLQVELEKLGVSSTLQIIKTQGDKIQHLGFDKLEGKGFFTKEIEEHLLSGDIDLAVHSLKDMPTEGLQDLVLGAVSYRENPSDLLIIGPHAVDKNKMLKIKSGARVGTSSNRRKAQLLDMRPDLDMVDIRGNVTTRLGKIAEGKADAVMLAKAGLKRLQIDLSNFKVIELHPREFVPAPGQGILTYQTRADNTAVRKLLAQIHNKEVGMCSNVERAVLKQMGGGCSMPLGVYCELDSLKNYHVWASYASFVGEPLRKVRISSATQLDLVQEIVDKLKE
jgi:hydroxymethylbilane synthase